VSAENHNPSGPADGAPGGAAEPSNHAADSVGGGVVTSHGEREKRAYVAPVEVPRRNQRLQTMDMSKVRISPDMKIQQLDPRAMPTRKMDIPPGGIRPMPPPANTEVADPQSASQPAVGAASPWSQNAGIDRSMLPSAAMAPPAPAQAQRIPSMPPPLTKPASKIGAGVWIAVVLLAALLGGGVAFALRSSGSSGSTEPVSSSAPIAITVPSTSPVLTGTDNAEPEVVEPNTAASADTAGASTTSPKTTAPRTAPRRTSPSKTSAPAPAPAPTTTRPRLFN
jgi:hypothetical protein